MIAHLRIWADRLIGLSANLGALGLIVEVGVILVDVIGRSFGVPLYGSQDLISMSMVVLVFGAMALCDRQRGHIAVDLFEPRFPAALNRAIDILAALLGAVVFAFIAYAIIDSAKLSVMLNLSTNLLRLPKAWFQWGLAGFSIITALGMTLRAVELCLPGGRPPFNKGDGLMSAEALGFSGIVALLILLVLRVPVAFAMFLVGFLGIWALNGWNGAMGLLSSETFTLASSSELVVVPLFILMGNIASTTGMSRQLYNAAYAVIGHIRGGLASATLLGCGGFAALSGSSVASALTMGKVSLSEMDRYGYDPRLSTGVVAAGGTLGILIPPSTGFVIFAILTEQSIGRLFLAGVFPGLLLLAIFVITVSIICWFRPEAGPPGLRRSLSEKLTAVTGALPILLVIASTIGGIYGGLFSPVEAAGVGAAFVIIYGIVTRSLSLSAFWQAARASVVTTATVMLILIAAHMVNPFLALSHVPTYVGEALIALDIPVLGTLVLMLLVYLVLGCFLEGFAMLVLTLPIFFPVVLQMGIDPIWFGVLVVLTLEMGLISPPVGINVFIVKSVAPKVALADIFRGVLPFWLAMLVTLGILIAFPQISLLLPNTMFN